MHRQNDYIFLSFYTMLIYFLFSLCRSCSLCSHGSVGTFHWIRTCHERRMSLWRAPLWSGRTAPSAASRAARLALNQTQDHPPLSLTRAVAAADTGLPPAHPKPATAEPASSQRLPRSATTTTNEKSCCLIFKHQSKKNSQFLVNDYANMLDIC